MVGIGRPSVDNDRNGVESGVVLTTDQYAIGWVAYVGLMVSSQNGRCGECLKRFVRREVPQTAGVKESLDEAAQDYVVHAFFGRSCVVGSQ